MGVSQGGWMDGWMDDSNFLKVSTDVSGSWWLDSARIEHPIWDQQMLDRKQVCFIHPRR
ncbi:hypothetical protein BO70DRAFT_361646, partial [Aspergillus heteromorphus CBS 117.55]